MVGSGPNGLAAAITLARAGLDVVVHEAAERVGGGMRTEEVTLPGFRHDVCSAIHPLARSSAFFRELELGVDWIESPAAAAHPLDDEEAVLLVRSLEETAAGLGADASAYRSLIGPLAGGWRVVQPLFLATPPFDLRLPLRALRELGGQASLRALRAGLSTAVGLAERTFSTRRARALVAGNAAHSMLPLERRPSAGFALALLTMGHAVGWPFPRGGSQALAEALAARLREHGGEIRTSSRVDELPRADVVLCDVSPRELLRLAPFPARYEAALRRYRHGPGAFKLDWACHVPNGSEADMTDSIESQVERFAPGFRERILARSALGPAQLEAHNSNLVGGDINGGLMDLRQLYARPVGKLVPYRTPRRGVYLCSASTLRAEASTACAASPQPTWPYATCRSAEEGCK